MRAGEFKVVSREATRATRASTMVATDQALDTVVCAPDLLALDLLALAAPTTGTHAETTELGLRQRTEHAALLSDTFLLLTVALLGRERLEGSGRRRGKQGDELRQQRLEKGCRRQAARERRQDLKDASSLLGQPPERLAH
jgi:hypothetical protein